MFLGNILSLQKRYCYICFTFYVQHTESDFLLKINIWDYMLFTALTFSYTFYNLWELWNAFDFDVSWQYTFFTKVIMLYICLTFYVQNTERDFLLRLISEIKWLFTALIFSYTFYNLGLLWNATGWSDISFPGISPVYEPVW